MTLTEAIAAAGMTPPREIVPGRFIRFPGAGKGRSNRAGWCKSIAPTLAVYGDFSTGLSATWVDETHRDDADSKRLIEEARRRARQVAAEERRKQNAVADKAARLIHEAATKHHAYLERKGFADRYGLVHEDQLLIPIRDGADYQHVISVQLIAPDGKKRFLPGGRTGGGIHRIGVAPERARRVLMCEGYATGLSIEAALQRLPGPHTVIVCFSAYNLERVADSFPRAVVAADHDHSGAGEAAARRTGLPWVMPPECGSDFNDLHLSHGLHAVTEVLRSLN